MGELSRKGLFTEVRGKEYSQKFACTILHKSPSERREDGF